MEMEGEIMKPIYFLVINDVIVGSYDTLNEAKYTKELLRTNGCDCKIKIIQRIKR
jgi:hypothetical protein